MINHTKPEKAVDFQWFQGDVIHVQSEKSAVAPYSPIGPLVPSQAPGAAMMAGGSAANSTSSKDDSGTIFKISTPWQLAQSA